MVKSYQTGMYSLTKGSPFLNVHCTSNLFSRRSVHKGIPTFIHKLKVVQVFNYKQGAIILAVSIHTHVMGSNFPMSK